MFGESEEGPFSFDFGPGSTLYCNYKIARAEAKPCASWVIPNSHINGLFPIFPPPLLSDLLLIPIWVEWFHIMDAIDSVFDPLREFAKDSTRLVKRCHKPDRKGIYGFSYSIPCACTVILVFPFFIFWITVFWFMACSIRRILVQNSPR